MEPTNEQLQIIGHPSNCVVIAKPGSGKTFTMANKIKNIIPELPDYQGVIAISYTNKASDELKYRALAGGLEQKGSFFGTIDKFFISEIIIPFGNYLFGKSIRDLQVFSVQEEKFIREKDDKRVKKLNSIGYDNLLPKHINWIKRQFQKGTIFLELVGLLALFIFDKVTACQNYLKARYSHIIIDEYQDSGFEQHQMFLRLKENGIISIAVGDIDQSIFGFAKKDAKYLFELSQLTDGSMEVFSLTTNYRCHPSIVNYSAAFLNKNANLLNSDENRVFEKKVEGNQFNIADWISNNIERISDRFGLKKRNEIGILVRGKTTADIINSQLSIAHKYYKNTPFDNDTSVWSQLFSDLLYTVLDQDNNKYDLIEKYLDLNYDTRDAKDALEILYKITKGIVNTPYDLYLFEQDLIDLAFILEPEGENQKSLTILNKVLNNGDYIDEFLPAQSDEVQLMSIHKSKGLEFDIVLHLDLYDYIIPNHYDEDLTQYVNLHYVGITRAKKALYLVWSNKRFNSSEELKRGYPSEFLQYSNLLQLREKSMY